MPIPVACSCGRSMQVQDEQAGRRVLCPSCQSPLEVPRLRSQDAGAEALNLWLGNKPSGTDQGIMAADRPTISLTPKETRVETPFDAYPPPPSEGYKPPRRLSSFNPEITKGLLMMIGAVVWFFVGMEHGWVFYYPPILFFIGLGMFIRGFSSGS